MHFSAGVRLFLMTQLTYWPQQWGKANDRVQLQAKEKP
jgi:hypothetical protein